MYSARFSVDTDCCKACAGKSSADVNDQLVTQTVCAPNLATAVMSAQTTTRRRGPQTTSSLFVAAFDNALTVQSYLVPFQGRR